MKLSPTMRAAALAALNAGGKLYRHPGGIWNTDAACKHERMGICMRFGRHSTNTANALVKRGAAVVSKWGTRKSDGKSFPLELAVKPLEPRDTEPPA